MATTKESRWAVLSDSSHSPVESKPVAQESEDKVPLRLPCPCWVKGSLCSWVTPGNQATYAQVRFHINEQHRGQVKYPMFLAMSGSACCDKCQKLCAVTAEGITSHSCDTSPPKRGAKSNDGSDLGSAAASNEGDKGQGKGTGKRGNQGKSGESPPAKVQYGRAAGGLAAVSKATSPANVLVLTQGFGSLAGRTETSEGLERKLAVHHYSRQAFISCLLPNLRSARASKDAQWPGPRVLSVLAAGVHPPYVHYATDPDLEHHFSLKNAADAACMYNDCTLDVLSRAPENDGIVFMHAAPGFVATRWGREMPRPVQWLMSLIMPLGTSPEDCGKAMCVPIFDPAITRGFFPFGSSGQPVKATGLQEEAKQVVYDHTQDVLKRLMK